MLQPDEAVRQTREMLDVRAAEAPRLDLIHQYLRDKQRLWWIPKSAPVEVRNLARVARVNVLDFVVSTVAQALFVSGYRSTRGDSEPAWDIWQANRMDKRQVGLHWAGEAYGAAYATVLPGDQAPVIRRVSPRDMTTLYGEDDDWPVWALEKRRTAEGQLWRLFDDTHVYWIGDEATEAFQQPKLTFISSEEHGAGVTPVVRYLPEDNPDDEVVGAVEPLMALQDQINVTTFGLMVAQHYGAFRQRYILGWLADSEEQKLKASASQLWTFEHGSEGEVKVGEFEQTDLSGYIDSREATLRHLATVSQTPVHELLGTMANLSAEALVAARHSSDRKAGVREVTYGESHEQTLELAALMASLEVDPSAQVQWKDTTARSLAQVADALGKIADQLHVPPQALWEMIPGVDQQDVRRWREMADEQDAFAGLAAVLEGQGVSLNGDS